MKSVDVYTDRNVSMYVPLTGWRGFAHLLTLRLLSPSWFGARRMIVDLGYGSFLCHPDNLAALNLHLADCGYTMRHVVPKPTLKVVRNDGKKDS